MKVLKRSDLTLNLRAYLIVFFFSKLCIRNWLLWLHSFPEKGLNWILNFDCYSKPPSRLQFRLVTLFFFYVEGSPGGLFIPHALLQVIALFQRRPPYMPRRVGFIFTGLAESLLVFFFRKFLCHLGSMEPALPPKKDWRMEFWKFLTGAALWIQPSPPKKDWMSFDYCNEWTDGANPIRASRGLSHLNQHYKLSGQLAGWVSRSFVVQIVDVVQP